MTDVVFIKKTDSKKKVLPTTKGYKLINSTLLLLLSLLLSLLLMIYFKNSKSVKIGFDLNRVVTGATDI